MSTTSNNQQRDRSSIDDQEPLPAVSIRPESVPQSNDDEVVKEQIGKDSEDADSGSDEVQVAEAPTTIELEEPVK